MTDVKLHIHRFGPLEEVEIELAPMMIFTGMSNLGKSYANYAVYYFMYSVCGDGKLIEKLVSPKIDTKAIHQNIVLSTQEITSELQNGVEPFMRRLLGDDTISCNISFIIGGPSTHVFKLEKPHVTPEQGTDAYNYVLFGYGDGKMEYKRLNYNLERIISSCYREKLLGYIFKFAPILPPARGAFVGENYSIKSTVGSSVGMYENFFKDYDRGVQPTGENYADYSFFIKAVKKLLKGELLTEGGKQYLKLANGTTISLTAAASSIKELSPFLFYLKNHIGFSMSFCFEEPEAHLHPQMQVSLADLIAVCLHNSIFFQITTHSDYFLQRLNQLVKLGHIKTKDENRFNEICKEQQLDALCYINASDISAYYFHRNGSRISVDSLSIDKDGIPFNTFFDVANDLQQKEDYINDVLYELDEEGGKHD